MSWIIRETDQLAEKAVDRLGNKFLIGNGYIGYRGTLEEHTRMNKTATIVSGLYDQVGDLWREPVNLPNGGYVQVIYQGEPLHAWAVPVASHTQTLDIRHAVHERETIFDRRGRHPDHPPRASALPAAAQHHLFCVQYEIETSRDCELIIRTGIDGDVWDINGPHLKEFISSGSMLR